MGSRSWRSCFNLAYAENRNAAFGILLQANLPYEARRRLVLTGFAVVGHTSVLVVLLSSRTASGAAGPRPPPG